MQLGQRPSTAPTLVNHVSMYPGICGDMYNKHLLDIAELCICVSEAMWKWHEKASESRLFGARSEYKWTLLLQWDKYLKCRCVSCWDGVEYSYVRLKACSEVQ